MKQFCLFNLFVNFSFHQLFPLSFMDLSLFTYKHKLQIPCFMFTIRGGYVRKIPNIRLAVRSTEQEVTFAEIKRKQGQYGPNY